ncbi:MAG TPA: cupin domain-containing protein [Polyangiales bacterium]|nr:cupin domain-containing protein [Polyangiales bacterium]
MNDRPKDLGADNAHDVDAFLQDIQALDEAERASVPQLIAALGEDAPELDDEPASDLRARLMAALPETSRFDRFKAAVSQLLDIAPERAQRLLDQLDNRSQFYELMPGIELFWVEGGPRVANAVRGFVRVAAGLEFPEHEHHGEEQVLVLQGAFRDPTQDRTFRPGEVSVMPKGTSHLHIVPEDGPDLLILSVIQEGVSVGEQRYWPNQVPTTQR